MIYLNFMNQPFRFNAFGFSSAFLLWAVLGLVDGFIIPLFFVGVGLGWILYILLPSFNPTSAIIFCLATSNARVGGTPRNTRILIDTLIGFGYVLVSIMPLISSRTENSNDRS